MALDPCDWRFEDFEVGSGLRLRETVGAVAKAPTDRCNVIVGIAILVRGGAVVRNPVF